MSVQNFNLDIDDYTIAAGGYLELGKPADFFQIMEATGPVDITFLHSESAVGKAKGVGQGFRLGPLSNRFYGVKIYSPTAQTLKLCFSSGKSPVDLSQVVSVTGTVSVVNGELSKVLAGQAFSGVSDIAGAAGVYSHVQLWNPAASGKNLVISRMNSFSGTGATPIRIGKSSAALATLVGSGLNKMLSGAASSAELRSNNNAAVLFAAADRIQNVGVAAMYQTVDIPLGEPVIVVPGSGVTVVSMTVNTAMNASFQWSEVAV